ncbi:CUB and zona pellucida-like domain-containing protein 1 [Sebastes umbrosus]|uniref:CUB and zona pellucida-like domain-containing protein 1 n=1 Tax=Sebastes umbrosus TaxID=72105 RepID=UPI00189D1AFA|nr:CUB and zona pellucida-like domain-containing protein 1 [Sebastes umbrosus]
MRRKRRAIGHVAPTTTTTTTTTTVAYIATTPPLSKLPLQFSFLVDPPAPSCQEGHYLPKFVHPTPENGERLVAEVGKEFEIRVKAQAAYATIQDIIFSGPLNISKHRTTHGEFVIRWTPIADDQGDHYAICFAVEAVSGSAGTTVHTNAYHYGNHHHTPSSQSGIYQSEMRCVLVEVQNNHVNSHVICNESSMTIVVEKSSFRGLHEDHLQLSDPSNIACSLQTHSNSTHIIAVVPLNACGTQIEEDYDNLIFKNEITTVDNITDLITRRHLLSVKFKCQYPKRGNVTRSFTAHRDNICVWEKGFGRFTYQFEFYPDSNFQIMRDPNSYPLEYYVGNRIYMQIEATSSVDNTELFVESCTAAPYDNPNYRPTYSIIDNGCNVDSTVKVYSSANHTQFRFSIEAFKFIGLHDQVYISCSVLMCEAGSHGTRCSKGCMSSSPWSGRRKREAVTQSSRHFLSQGPLRLRRSAEIIGSPVINLNLNLVFIAGCLLAAVGMISAVAIYKTKVSKVKYQPLTTDES